MKEIVKLINIGEDESILGIFSDKMDSEISIEDLNNKYHNLEELPKSFFKITNKSISFKYIRIFTNLRFIVIGVNFWQLYDLYCSENREKMKIQNFILSIQKEDLKTISFLFGVGSNSIFLNGLVEIKCHTNEFYREIKKLLNEKWGFSLQELEKQEKKDLKFSILILKIFNFLQLIIGLGSFLSLRVIYVGSENTHIIIPILLILSSFFLLCTFLEAIYLYLGHKKKNLLISISLRLTMVVLFIFNLLLVIISIPFF